MLFPPLKDEWIHGFGVESYKQIRAEVGVLLTRIENLFRYSLLAMTAVFSWLLAQAFGVTEQAKHCLKLPKDALDLAWWLPCAFIVLSGCITLATHIRVMQMSDYLRRCEETLGMPGLSWEAFLGPKPPLFATVTTMAWLLMFAAAYFAASAGIALDAQYEICSTAK